MKAITLFALPVLGTAAAIITSRQAPLVTLVPGSGKTIGGNACPMSGFSQQISVDQQNLTLIFDKYTAFIGPSSPPDSREVTCDFQIQLQFPLGCTTGTVDTHPKGELRLKTGGTARYSGSYDFSTGTPSSTTLPPVNFVGTADPNHVQPFEVDQPVSVTEKISNQNQRVVTFTARTRLFLQSPGTTNNETSDFTVYAADILLQNFRSC